MADCEKSAVYQSTTHKTRHKLKTMKQRLVQKLWQGLADWVSISEKVH